MDERFRQLRIVDVDGKMKRAQEQMRVGDACWEIPAVHTESATPDDVRILREMRDKWASDLLGSVMPFWMRYSVDEKFGGFFTCLDNDGSIYDDTKYTWLQGREVYTLSRLYNEVPVGSESGMVDTATRNNWLAAAARGAAFMDHAKDEHGIIYFSTSRDGSERLHLQRKPYAAVFYVLGYLEFWRALKMHAKRGGGVLDRDASNEAVQDRYLRGAKESFDVLEQWIADPSLCGRPVTSRSKMPTAKESEHSCDSGSGPTVLADVMCMASLALEFLDKLDLEYGAIDEEAACVGTKRARESDADASVLARRERERSRYIGLVQDAMRNCERHFDERVDARTGRPREVFLEHCATQGLSGATPAGRVFNPGHSIEVAWFLLRMCDALPGGSTRHEQLALRVLEGSLELGWDEAHGGGLLYMLDIERKPLLDATVTAEGKLWWPCTEALIALLMAFARTGDNKWMRWLQRVHTYTYRTFVERKDVQNMAGEWFGYCNRDGSLARSCKGGNYKGCFHVPRALLMCVQIADAALSAQGKQGQ